MHDRVTPRLARFMFNGGALVRSRHGRVPTLLMWSGADRCVAPGGGAAFAVAALGDLVQSKSFDGLGHELFNEPERKQIMGWLAEWLRQRACAGSTHAAPSEAE